MDPRDEEYYELVVKNLRYVEECTRRLRSLNKKFDELTASDKKAELDAINALHKSILIKELPCCKVRTWRTNNSTLKKLLSRCVAEEEAHLNEANKSSTDNPYVAEGAGVNHNAVDNENCSAGDSGIPLFASARPSRRGAQAKKAKIGKRNGRKKQKRTRQSNGKDGDRKNLGDLKAFQSDADSNTQIRTADDNESLQSVDIFSDQEDNDYPMEEREDVTRGGNAAGREEEEVTGEDEAADREEEEVTRGDDPADREQEEVARGDNGADREEEEVTRGDPAADREEEEVTRGDDAADMEQGEVARRPSQSTENGTIDTNNSDPPESNGISELVASNADTNAENPPSTSSKSRKRKRASKSSAKKPKGKKEVKIVPRSLSSKKKVVPKNVGNSESAPSDASSNSTDHLAGDNDSSAALSKSSPRENAPMKKLEANKTKKNGRAIRRPTKSTKNRARCNDTRKNIGNLKSRARSTLVNLTADCSLTPSPSRDRQPTMTPTPSNAKERGENSQLSSQPPRNSTHRASNVENPEETTQLPSQSAREPDDRNNSNGRKGRDTVMSLPSNAESNGRNDLAQRSDNDSTRKPAQKRRPRRKRKPWNPRPRKTPSVRNKANARPQSDLRLQNQNVQPEQYAVINKSSHEPVEYPGYPGTQAHAPPRKRQRIVNVNVEVVHRAYLIHRGKTLMRVIETNFGRRVYPAIAPHRLRPLARVQPPIYEVERDPYRMYCYCKSSADGGMIGCDNKNCPYGGWFHYSCAGITNECYAPDGKWYCASCSPYYRDMGEPILNCPEEIPLVIVKEEPPTDDGCGEGPSSEEH
nr:Zinc finger domain containing protein [Haemonchus contortus]